MDLYVYLGHLAHVRMWEEGGPIPVKPASTYLAQEHRGSATPDETFVFSGFGGDARDLLRNAGIPLNSTVTNALFIDGDGVKTVDHYRREDGLVLCFFKAQRGDHPEIQPRFGSWQDCRTAERKRWRGFAGNFRNCGAVPNG